MKTTLRRSVTVLLGASKATVPCDGFDTPVTVSVSPSGSVSLASRVAADSVIAVFGAVMKPLSLLAMGGAGAWTVKETVADAVPPAVSWIV